MLDSIVLMSLFIAVSILYVFINPASLSWSVSLEVISFLHISICACLLSMVGHDLLYVLVDKIFALGISTGLYDAIS